MNKPTPAKRLGIIGDVHAEHDRLESALDFLASENVCHILCTGDIVDGRGNPNKSIELLKKHNVKVVRGNHDRWLLQNKARHIPNAHTLAELSPLSLTYLESLPHQVIVESAAGTVLLCHGVGKNDLGKVWPGTAKMPIEASKELDEIIASGEIDIVINGHMHFQTLIQFNNLSLINGGSLVGKRWPGFSLLDLEIGQIQVLEFEGSSVRRGKSTTLSHHSSEWDDTQDFSGDWDPVLLFEVK
ncbi:MAG: putative phosphoesterase [Candidatus Azotimanducaceae bacterium]|jgi:putative phosphoesterase